MSSKYLLAGGHVQMDIKKVKIGGSSMMGISPSVDGAWEFLSIVTWKLPTWQCSTTVGLCLWMYFQNQAHLQLVGMHTWPSTYSPSQIRDGHDTD